jgi:hypothetical protein
MNGPQMAEFSEAVNAVFNVQDFSAVLQKLDKKFTDFAPAALAFPKQVDEVVATASSKGWIAQLVVEVVNARPNSQKIKDFLAKNPDWDPSRSEPNEHPCDTLFLLGGKSLVGRDGLREYIKAMEVNTDFKVLLVTSDRRRVGKTYSKELIDYFAASTPGIGAVYIDLDKDDYGPGTLAAELAREVGIAGIAPDRGQQQAARWNQELVKWLIPRARNPNGIVWWIVLDGFSTRLPSEETRDFIQQLAQRVQSTLSFRLILVNYCYELSLDVSGFLFKEKVDSVTTDELKAFLTRLHQQKRKAAPSEQELSSYVKGVYDRLAKYKEQHPQLAQDQLLLNLAVVDVRRTI